ncbi:MAG: hypothetical protein Q9219_001300 [cf. Caloplaca sp. 3 TL-2023]
MNALKSSTLDELRKVYDHLIPVDQIINKSPANLYLMHRPDLGAAFTKIALWRQVRFQKIVYLDADMVALRAPDELFHQESNFAAVPDIGWPDCFNSGLLVLSPNMGDYYSLLALAQRGISFDGADQGLLNVHFQKWDRLSFTYNCTPSGNYQYVPAYRHFQSSINMVHFIGPNKPWKVGRDWNGATGVYEELMGRWWAVYDKHYHSSTVQFMSGQLQPGLGYMQQYVKGEASTSDSFGLSSTATPLTNTAEIPMTEETEPVDTIQHSEVRPLPTTQQRRYFVDWDPSHHPPPLNSRPEAYNFPSATYQMSSDRNLFQPPASYSEPPKDMHNYVPPTPPSTEPLKPIFPWEENMAKPKRVFPDDPQPTPSGSAPSITTTAETKPDSPSPATPTIKITSPPSQPFSAAGWKNVWDEIPAIKRYVERHPLYRYNKNDYQFPLRQRGFGSPRSYKERATSTEDLPFDPNYRRPSLIITDFPSEIERPSLPVTPVPIRRPTFWGQERDDAGDLPQAEGVPDQSQWDPWAKLLELQRRKSDVLTNDPSHKRDLPERPLPKSSVPLPEEESKPTPTLTVSVPQLATLQREEARSTQATNADDKSETGPVLSPVEA